MDGPKGFRHEKLTIPCVARGQKYSKQIADLIWNQASTYAGSGHNLGHGHNNLGPRPSTYRYSQTCKEKDGLAYLHT